MNESYKNILGYNGDIQAEPFGADSNGVTWTEYRVVNLPDSFHGDRLLVRRDGLIVGTYASNVFNTVTTPGARYVVVENEMATMKDRIEASSFLDKKYPLSK